MRDGLLLGINSLLEAIRGLDTLPRLALCIFASLDGPGGVATDDTHGLISLANDLVTGPSHSINSLKRFDSTNKDVLAHMFSSKIRPNR